MYWSDTSKLDTFFDFHIEASSRCNARCPSCPRFIPRTKITHPLLKQADISIDNFKKWFPESTLQRTNTINFCGNFGDPATCVDFIEIIKYINSVHKPHMFLMEIRTNGGTRKEEFWHELGKLCNSKKNMVVFSIDGLEDTNHLYRREVNWETVVRNVKAFTSAGGYAIQELLLFKHNQHQLEDIEQFCKEVGIKELSIKSPFGLEDDLNRVRFDQAVYKENGYIDYMIQQADMFVNKDLKKVHFTHFYPQSVNMLNIEDKHRGKEASNIYSSEWLSNQHKSVEDLEISCESFNKQKLPHLQSREVFVNPVGLVYPCCYISPNVAGDLFENEPNLTKHIDSLEMLNLNHNSLESILKLFDRFIADKWNSKFKDGKPYACARTCSKKAYNMFDKTNLIREKRLLK